MTHQITSHLKKIIRAILTLEVDNSTLKINLSTNVKSY